MVGENRTRSCPDRVRPTDTVNNLFRDLTTYTDVFKLILLSYILTAFSLQGGWMRYIWKAPIYAAFNLFCFFVLGKTHPSTTLVFLALGHNRIALVRWWNPMIYSIAIFSSAIQFMVLLGGTAVLYQS